MIKTYKFKHNRDFTKELIAARKVAEFAIAHRDRLSTKYVKQFGLKSAISNQVIRKYGWNKDIKKINSVKLTLKGSDIQIENKKLWTSSLRLSLELPFELGKVRQAELDDTYIYLAVDCVEPELIKTDKRMGIDLNTTGHCVVAAIKETGKVYKLGKKAEHIHKKYSNMRKSLQKQGHYGVVKKIKQRESNIVKDLNHKISRYIVDKAVEERAEIRMEKLKGIKNRRAIRSFRYALHSWSYFQLNKFIEYKAALAGIPVTYIDPAYTSKCCSRCGLIGQRNDKYFKCQCGHVEHADINAAFNIASISPSIVQLQEERDSSKRSTVTRQEATQLSNATPKLN